MYKLSKLAAEDFMAIYEYTLLNFGAKQADSYTASLEKTFQLLYENPLMSYQYSSAGEKIRRHNHQKHSIFYIKRKLDIFIIRLLHLSRKPALHEFKV